MTVARQATRALDTRITEEGGDKPIQGPRPELKFSSVSEPAKKTTPRRPAKATKTVPTEPTTTRTSRRLGLTVLAGKATEEKRRFWTVEDAARQVRDGYAVFAVVNRTGYSEDEVRRAMRA